MQVKKRLLVLKLVRAWLVVLAVECVARVALAEPVGSGRTSALSWVRLTGAEECIGALELAASVEARLGRRVFVPPADAEISVEGSVAYRADTKRFKATFRVADRSGAVLGVRDVEESAASCQKLDARIAFVLSVLIDPLAAPADVGDAPPLPAPVSPPVAAEVSSPPSPAAPVPWRWLAGVEFGGSAGFVPDVGWLVSGGGIVTPPRWPGFRAKVSSFLPTTQRVDPSASVDVRLVLGQVGICPLQIRRPPLGVTVCFDGVLGELAARGGGFADSRRFGALLGGVALDAVGELALTRVVRVTLSPTLLIPFSHVRLAYDDTAGNRRTLYDAAPVGVSVALGVAVGSRGTGP